jgi:hypothetical protein
MPEAAAMKRRLGGPVALLLALLLGGQPDRRGWGAAGAPETTGQPGSFAGAASQAGFQAPAQRLDLGQYGFENKLPPGYIAVNLRHLSSFPIDGDHREQSDPFAKPRRLKHPRRTVPADIKALNGKKVAVLGYMLCFEFQFKGASHFALLRSQAGCCFGTAPLLNEWVDVRMNGLTSLYMDTPVVVMGTLRVKEIREYGNLMGLYSMKGDRVEKAVVKELGPGAN